MIDILVKPKNSIINQYKHLFKLDNIDLIFTDQALQEIVSMAIKRKTGARALRSVLEGIMLNIMYDMPSKKNIKTCTINSDVVINKNIPRLTYYKKSA